MKTPVIIDARYAMLAKKEWGEDLHIIPSKKQENVDEAISCHPDVSLFKIGRKLIVAPNVFDYYMEALKDYDITIICGEKNPDRHYPSDCAYNIAVAKDVAFFKKDIIDSVAYKAILKENLKTAHVKQGYAKCSTVLGENFLITQDETIYASAEKNGVSALKISPGGVVLNPYEYGFLGGATGYYNGTVYFFGDIEKHKDYVAIKNFLTERKIKIKYIKNYPLTDIGTIFFPY